MFHEEYMTCRGICAKYRAPGPKERSRYNAGQKRCQKCGLFVICNDLNCPCCGAKLRTKPRNTNISKLRQSIHNKTKSRIGEIRKSKI